MFFDLHKEFSKDNDIEVSLNRYITFTRFSEYIHNGDKISCDWCSIFNGSLEFISHVVLTNRNIKITNSFLDVAQFILDEHVMKYHMMATKYLKKFDNTCDDYETKIQLFISNVDGYHNLPSNTQKALYIIEKLKIMTHDIESTWCPFKHMKHIDFDREYYFYDSNSKEELKQAANIIKKAGIITCENCSRIINEGKNNTTCIYIPSLFEPYMNEIKRFYGHSQSTWY